MSANLKMLEIAASGLQDLLSECVFVGGAITALYLDSPGAAEPRPTDDVDCVVEITSRTDYQALEEKLRGLGFKNDRRPKSPLCRWTYRGVTLDVMPTDEKILGFTNRWYQAGIEHQIKKILPSGLSISIFSLPYFIATKLEAYNSRGQNDPRLSSDIEDILFVIDGSNDPLKEISDASSTLKTYLSKTFQTLLKSRDFTDAIEIHLSREGPQRISRTREIISAIL